MKKRTLRLGRLVACIMMLWSMTACATVAKGMIVGIVECSVEGWC